MKYAEIWPLVVEGYKVTCDRFGPGTFVDYQFNGLRINHAGGSSSGFTPRDEDMAVEWHLVPDEAPAKPEQPFGLYVQQFGRALRPTPGPAIIEDFAAPAKPWKLDRGDKPAVNVGKWGKVAVVPKRDSWGRIVD